MVNCERFYNDGHCIDVVKSPFGRFAYLDDQGPFELTKEEYYLIKSF